MSGFRSVKKFVGLTLLSWAVVDGAAYGAITFDVGGLAGTGVTGQVTFAYNGATNTTGSLVITIENTSTVGGRISGFAFNVPTVNGVSFLSFGGGLNDGGVMAIASPNSSAVPENSASNESGWFSRWSPDGIKSPNAAGDFDVGVLNSDSADAFITGGTGSGPRITNFIDANDSTTFTLNLVGTGLQSMSDADFEQAFLSELSSDAGFYSFGVRYQAIGANDLSDFAVPVSTTNPVPVPGAALLAAFGLGFAGLVGRKRPA